MRFFRCYSDFQYTTKPGIKQHPRQKFSVYPAGRTGMVISVTNFFRSILILSRRPQTRSFRRVRVKRFLQKGFTFSRLSHIRCGVCAASRREYVSNEVRYAAQSSFSRADVRYFPRSGLRHALRRLSGRLYLPSAAVRSSPQAQASAVS